MKIHECTSPMRCLGQGIEEYEKLVPAAMNFYYEEKKLLFF